MARKDTYRELSKGERKIAALQKAVDRDREERFLTERQREISSSLLGSYLRRHDLTPRQWELVGNLLKAMPGSPSVKPKKEKSKTTGGREQKASRRVKRINAERRAYSKASGDPYIPYRADQ